MTALITGLCVAVPLAVVLAFAWWPAPVPPSARAELGRRNP